jgi:hypothetical protein
VPPFKPTEGGGATTFGINDASEPWRFPRGLPPPSAETEVGGGATLSGRVGRDPLPVPFAFTEVGGGATTSVGPKIRPIKLLINDPLAEGDGGGGATAFDASGGVAPVRRRISAVTSVEVGGATTAGAGKLSLDRRTSARSGAETGGGTTDGSMV